jgi:hypothetical protein
MTVKELQARMDGREISEWLAYDRIDPPDRWPSAIARLLHWLGCCWSKKPPSYESFFPRAEPVQMSPAEIRARLRGG